MLVLHIQVYDYKRNEDSSADLGPHSGGAHIHPKKTVEHLQYVLAF